MLYNKLQCCFYQLYFKQNQQTRSIWLFTSIGPLCTYFHFKPFFQNTEMRDNSNDSTVQTIYSMESSLQDLKQVMINLGTSINSIGTKIQKVAELFFKALARQHEHAVGIMDELIHQSSNKPALPVESNSIPKKDNAHKPLQHIRAASNPSLLELKDENEESFHSSATAAFKVIIDHKTEVEKLSVTEIIDKMAQFRQMWSNQSISTEEKLRFKKKYEQEVNQAHQSKDIAKESKHKILKIRMELIGLNNKGLIATIKSKSRSLINKE